MNHGIMESWRDGTLGFLKDITLFNFVVHTIIAINPTL
jgi:hypothetical protein